jgi:hypothetical protein
MDFPTMALVSVSEARLHLRIDDELDSNGDPIAPDDDPDLTLKIQAASAAVLNYLKGFRNVWQAQVEMAGPYPVLVDGRPVPIVDTNGDPIYVEDSDGTRVVREEVRAATLLMLGYLWKDRDENADGAYEMGYLPKPVTALLYPLRDPVVR